MKKRVFSMLLALIMALSLLPTMALAATSTVSFQISNSNGCTGTVSYKFSPESSFTTVSNGSSVNVPSGAASITVKALPDGDGKINQPNSGIWIGSTRLEGVDFSALQSESGYTYTLTEDTPQFQIEFDNNDGLGGPGGGQENRTYSVNFGTASWTVNETIITASVADKTLTGGAVELNDNDEIVLTHFDPDTMDAALSAEDGFTTTLVVTEGKTHMNSLPSGVGLPNGTLTFSVREKQNNPGPGGGQGGDPQPNPRDELYKGDQKSVNIEIASGDADFCINNSNMINGHGNDPAYKQFNDVRFKMAAGNNTTVDFYVSSFINERYTSFKINDVEYVGQLPKPSDSDFTQKMLGACTGQINDFKIEGVPFAATYTISATKKALTEEDAAYCVVGNFLWRYDANTEGQPGGGPEGQPDDALFGGNLEFVSVTYNETTYDSLEELKDAPACYDWAMANGNDPGMALFPAGASLTVRLVPDYGNQLVAFGPNGQNDFTTDASTPCVYTFTVAKGNFHLGARFAPVSDSVVTNSAAVTAGTVNVADNTVENGTVRMTVDNGTAIETLPDGMTGEKIAAVDIKLDNVYYAGSETVNEKWTTNLTELNGEATVSLEVPGLVEGATYKVVREHEGAKPAALDATYSNGKLTFASDKFSTYTIVRLDKTVTISADKINTTGSTNSIDVATSGATSVTAPKDVLDDVVKADATKPVAFKLNTNTSVEFNTEAVKAIAVNMTTNDNITLTLTPGAAVTNEKEQTAMDTVAAGNANAQVVKLELKQGDTKLFTEPTGAKATVTVPFAMPAGCNRVNVYYLNSVTGKADYVGTASTANGTAAFTVEHFSSYALVPTYVGGSGSVPSGHTMTTNLSGITAVYVDGKKVDSKNYTVSGGNVTLTQAYLDTLSAGKHSFKAENATHIATGTFTVAKGAVSPQTADAGIAIYIGMSVMSLAGMGWVGRKKKS